MRWRGEEFRLVTVGRHGHGRAAGGPHPEHVTHAAHVLGRRREVDPARIGGPARQFLVARIVREPLQGARGQVHHVHVQATAAIGIEGQHRAIGRIERTRFVGRVGDEQPRCAATRRYRPDVAAGNERYLRTVGGDPGLVQGWPTLCREGNGAERNENGKQDRCGATSHGRGRGERDTRTPFPEVVAEGAHGARRRQRFRQGGDTRRHRRVAHCQTSECFTSVARMRLSPSIVWRRCGLAARAGCHCDRCQPPHSTTRRPGCPLRWIPSRRKPHERQDAGVAGIVVGCALQSGQQVEGGHDAVVASIFDGSAGAWVDTLLLGAHHLLADGHRGIPEPEHRVVRHRHAERGLWAIDRLPGSCDPLRGECARVRERDGSRAAAADRGSRGGSADEDRGRQRRTVADSCVRAVAFGRSCLRGIGGSGPRDAELTPNQPRP